MAIPTRVVEIPISIQPHFHKRRVWHGHHDSVAQEFIIFPPFKMIGLWVMQVSKSIGFSIAAFVFVQKIVPVLVLKLFPEFPMVHSITIHDLFKLFLAQRRRCIGVFSFFQMFMKMRHHDVMVAVSGVFRCLWIYDLFGTHQCTVLAPKVRKSSNDFNGNASKSK